MQPFVRNVYTPHFSEGIGVWLRCALPLLAFWLLLFVGSAAAEGSSEALFREGLVCYGEINFACAKSKLESALAQEGAGGNRERLIEIHRYLAYSQVALGELGGARQSFERILSLDPAFTLDDASVSPKISGLFAEVRRSWALAQSLESAPKEPKAPEKAPPLAPEKAPEPSPPPPLPEPPKPLPAPKRLAGADLAASFLLQAKDRRAFHPGLALAPYLLWPLGFGVYGGLALEFRFFAKRKSVDPLYELGLFARFAYRVEAGSFRFLLPLSLGPTMFGRGSPAKRLGLAAGVHPSFMWLLTKSLEFGPQFGLRSTLDPQNGHASGSFELGLGLHGLF